MQKKIRNVLFPYLVLSTIAISYYMLIKHEGMHVEFGIENPALGYLFYFLTGQIFSAYWYIPMILVIFSLSPIFIKLIDLRLPAWIVFGLLLLPLLFQRPHQNFNILQSLVYFAPLYILGSWTSLNSQRIYRLLHGKELLLLAMVLLLALVQAWYYPYSGNAHKNAFELALPDINLIQKTIMCFMLFVVLHRFENREFRILVFLASVSFPIYFLHPFIIAILDKLKRVINLEFDSSFLTLAFTTALVVCLSAWVAILGRKVIGRRYSRSLIGW